MSVNHKLYLIESALSCKLVLISLGVNLNTEQNCVYLRSKSYYAFTNKKHGSSKHVAFMEASKAFEWVNRRKRLRKLEKRGVPMYILRLLSNELIGQYTRVRWTIFSLQLHRQSIGCSVGGTVVNHMLY